MVRCKSTSTLKQQNIDAWQYKQATIMKKFAILFIFLISLTINGQAQTFTQQIQQTQAGKGKITITQSKEIDDLVNGIGQKVITSPSTSSKPSTSSAASNRRNEHPTTSNNKIVQKKQESLKNESLKDEERRHTANKPTERSYEEKAEKTATVKSTTAKPERNEKAEESHHAETHKQSPNEEDDMHIPTIDMRKKVMRNSRKVTGYRVQAFAGGNTRNDKLRAQQTGEAIKMQFPDQPIYVHFYSPRWICRVGNYRSYQEAARMLKAVKAMGYRSATIVKGKITVFD